MRISDWSSDVYSSDLEKHQAAKKLLAAGVDPGLQRKAARAVAVDRAANSFAVVGEELLQKRAKKLAAGTATRERRLFEKDLEPYVGGRPVAEDRKSTRLNSSH